MERNDYLILTQPISRVMASLTQWLKLNFSGTMIWGQRRLGKSHCAEFIKRYLADTLGYRISVILLCVRKHDVVRENDFLDQIMRSLQVKASKRASKDERMELIVNKFLVLARRCPVHKVIFVLDDAQRLHNLHYEVLMSIQNELYQQYRVMLFTLLVGQPQLKAKKELLVAAGEKQITARMMADDLEFVGHRSLEEVVFAYKRLDENCFYPAKSNISFTQGLAPEAWAADWRLAHEAEPVWNEYVGRREDMGLAIVEEISMEALMMMANYIYQRYANQPGFRGLTPEQVQDVVDAAGLLQLETPVAQEGGVEGVDEEAEETVDD
jgi:hypothetical protein